MRGHRPSPISEQRPKACPNPLSPNRAPFGLRRYWAICRVAAPQRCSGIACVAAPCIWPPTSEQGPQRGRLAFYHGLLDSVRARDFAAHRKTGEMRTILSRLWRLR